MWEIIIISIISIIIIIIAMGPGPPYLYRILLAPYLSIYPIELGSPYLHIIVIVLDRG
jgi:hypothetical protein